MCPPIRGKITQPIIWMVLLLNNMVRHFIILMVVLYANLEIQLMGQMEQHAGNLGIQPTVISKG